MDVPDRRHLKMFYDITSTVFANVFIHKLFIGVIASADRASVRLLFFSLRAPADIIADAFRILNILTFFRAVRLHNPSPYKTINDRCHVVPDGRRRSKKLPRRGGVFNMKWKNGRIKWEMSRLEWNGVTSRP
jgi:hypothetical protein